MTPITAEQLQSMQDRNRDLILINTLSADDFEATKIPGAINIPQDEEGFVDQVERRAGGRDKTLVVYCASPECESSSQAARKLEKAGFEKVFDFEGGFQAWQQSQQNAPAHATAPRR
jgi:rhodanese-related sulfurtransferase